jgi:hypothetical protein
MKNGAAFLHAHVVTLSKYRAIGSNETSTDGDTILGQASLCFGESSLESQIRLHWRR